MIFDAFKSIRSITYDDWICFKIVAVSFHSFKFSPILQGEKEKSSTEFLVKAMLFQISNIWKTSLILEVLAFYLLM